MGGYYLNPKQKKEIQMVKRYSLVRVISSCPSKSFIDSGRYFSTHGTLVVWALVVDEEEDDVEDEDADIRIYKNNSKCNIH
jgi:hypothetical protein